MKRVIYSALLMLSIVTLGFGDNPIIDHIFTADAAAMVYNGTVYVYTGHDECAASGSNYHMNDWRVFSSTDMVNWKDLGEVLWTSTFSWSSGDAWASEIIEKNGQFFWYICTESSGKAVGVAVGNSPTGPFTDARGTALVTNGMTTATSITWDDIDPTVFIDDDGQAYLYWGNTACYWAKLKANMIELDGSINVVPSSSVPNFTEAPFIHKRNNIYYLSYAANWPETIEYSTSSSVQGPWTYRGAIISQTLPSGTSHQSIFEYEGDWYMTYHNADLPSGGDYRRSVCLDYLYYNGDGTIQPFTMTSGGVDPVLPTSSPEPTAAPNSLIWSGGPYALDGSNDYVDLPDNIMKTCDEVTIAAWVNLNSTSTWSRIFDFGNDELNYLFLTPQASGGVIRYAVKTYTNGDSEQMIEGGSALSTGSWQHVAVTLSGNTGRLYVNGSQVGSNSSMSISPAEVSNGITTNNWIGKSQWADPYLDGDVDDFRIYNYALNSTEIGNLAANPPGTQTTPPPTTPPPTTPPPGDVLDFEDFESDFGDWTNITGDDDDWYRNTGTTPSSSTGPDGDNTTGSGYYIHMETSSGYAYTSGDEVILESQEYDATGNNISLSFYYHMYGSNIGSLNVDVYDGSWDYGVWSISGQQHSSSSADYTQANVNLSSYSGNIRIRIRGVAAGSYRGDIAVDDIEIRGDGAPPTSTPTSSPTPTAGPTTPPPTTPPPTTPPPAGLIYYVDAGDDSPTSLESGESFGSRNSREDQAYGSDPSTGYSWGYQTYGSTWSQDTGTANWDSLRTDEGDTAGYGITYRFAVANGTYQVDLGFYDPWNNSGRGMDIVIEGTTRLSDFVPGSSQQTRSYSASVSDGELTIGIIRNSGTTGQYEDPMVSWIEVSQ